MLLLWHIKDPGHSAKSSGRPSRLHLNTPPLNPPKTEWLRTPATGETESEAVQRRARTLDVGYTDTASVGDMLKELQGPSLPGEGKTDCPPHDAQHNRQRQSPCQRWGASNQSSKPKAMTNNSQNPMPYRSQKNDFFSSENNSGLERSQPGNGTGPLR